jgi:hypothetical protein
MALYRLVLLTVDEEDRLLALRAAFYAVQTPSHDSADESQAVHRLLEAESAIAESHGLVPNKSVFSYASRKNVNWRVGITYPFQPEEEERVRGLG